MTEAARKLIIKYGLPAGNTRRGGKIGKATCTVCGKEIRSDDTAQEVGYSETRRRTAVFWHLHCQGDIWNSRIH